MTLKDKLSAAYKSWNDTKGTDHDKWLDLVDDNVVFISLAGGAPGMEFTKECKSKEDVRQYFNGLNADWDMIHYSPEDYVVDGDLIAVRGTCGWKNRKTGKIVDTPKADFFKFKDGKIIEVYEFYDTAKAFAGAQEK